MPTPTTRMQADIARKKLQQAFADSELVFAVSEIGYLQFLITAGFPSDPGGLAFHPMEVDNGASGINEEVLKRLNCLIEGTEYTPPVYRSFAEFITGGSNVYDDTITTQSGLHTSGTTVLDGGGGQQALIDLLQGHAKDVSDGDS